MEHCIVYFSTSVGLFQEEDLVAILEQSRRNNARQGITGVLLYVRGSIIQVLEGDKEPLEALYNRIERDQRHKNISRVLSRPITERLFTQWSMGYETLTSRQLDALKTIVNLNDRQETTIESDSPVVLKMIKLFYESNRHN